MKIEIWMKHSVIEVKNVMRFPSEMVWNEKRAKDRTLGYTDISYRRSRVWWKNARRLKRRDQKSELKIWKD